MKLRMIPLLTGVVLVIGTAVASAQDVPDTIRASVEEAIARVKPALVQIKAVATDYGDGREFKNEIVGSGVVISKDGYIVTNHHVAGHAKRMTCIFTDKQELDATLVGADPLTDIAVIHVTPPEGREFPVAQFGDSDSLFVGQYVMAMGCPMAISQSVTLGIVSNTEMIMPEWQRTWGKFELDGEDVGALVRWIAHDAEIHGGNSGGPLVNLNGEVIGVNEIRMGLAGAIPGNLAKSVAEALIAANVVRRSWLGIEVQPMLKRDADRAGVLIANALPGTPAASAGIKPGDILIRVGDTPVHVRFAEQLPAFNRLMSDLPVDAPVNMTVLRQGQEQTITVSPIIREAAQPKEQELKQWGITARNLSVMNAKELKRENKDGVLITSVRPGGPAGEAKPAMAREDILIEVNGQPVKSLEELLTVTQTITTGKTDPVPVLTTFERKTEKIVTVVRVGIPELPDPAQEVQKAWLPVETQVLTRDIAEVMGKPEMTGFRVTEIYENTSAAKAGLTVGDVILAVDDEPMTASAPEHYEELASWIRQYDIGTEVDLKIWRAGSEQHVKVALMPSPKTNREMKRHQDADFEISVRDISYFDKAGERLPEEQAGVWVDEVKPGGWAALGGISSGDIIVDIENEPVANVEAFVQRMDKLRTEKPSAVVFQVLRGVHRVFVELEPKWDATTK